MPQLHLGRFPGWILWVILGLTCSGGALAAQEKPQRVVSINLCADQLLLRLADREQIVSLSPLAKDPSLSFLADHAAGLPENAGRGEEILFENADLVLAGTFGQHSQVELLKRQGIDVLTMGPWESLDNGREQIRSIAKRLGHPGRGEALVAEIDAALERTKVLVPAGRSILTYYRMGWVPASHSLIGELLQHMGFVLHQKTLGLEYGGVPRLENIVVSPPDYMLMHTEDRQAVDNGSSLLVHPSLTDAVPAERRLTVSGNLALCGGPSTPALIDAVAAEVRAKVR